MLGALGVPTVPAWALGCKRPKFTGDVVVVGAGAAGLTAGYLLGQAGVSYTVLEASPQHGGRLRKNDTFVDFPLDVGGEWVHTRRTVLNELSQTRSAHTLAREYTPTTCQMWDGTRLTDAHQYARDWRGEYRFKDTTWADFFDQLIAPEVVPSIQYNTPVTRIDSSGSRVVVTTQSGAELKADKVVFTAPLRVLIDGDIAFVPPLPASKTDAFSQVDMPGGIKVFIEFAESFYPHIIIFDDPTPTLRGSERIYYDVALHKPTDRHVLGLFAVGELAPRYTDFESDDARIEAILRELDAMFGGAASRHYRQHITQNWTTEPFIRGSYSMFHTWRAVKPLGRPIDNTIYFAGEAYNTRDSWGFAHLASRAAYDVVDAILTD